MNFILNICLKSLLLIYTISFIFTAISCGKNPETTLNSTDIQADQQQTKQKQENNTVQQTQPAITQNETTVQQIDDEIQHTQFVITQNEVATKQALQEVEQILSLYNPDPPDPAMLAHLEKTLADYNQAQETYKQAERELTNLRKRLITINTMLFDHGINLIRTNNERKKLALKYEESERLFQEKQQKKDEANNQLAIASTALNTCKQQQIEKRKAGYIMDCSRKEQIYQQAQAMFNKIQKEYEEQKNQYQRTYNNLVTIYQKITELRRAFIQTNTQSDKTYEEFKDAKERLFKAREENNNAYQNYNKARETV